MIGIQKNKAKRKPQAALPTVAGLRLTRQRQEVYNVLMEKRDHPTANQVFTRVRERIPSISLATVYNCLDALVKHRLVRQVNFDREPSRFCPNLVEHGHFSDMETGAIYDITFKKGISLNDVMELPPGACVSELEFTLRGTVKMPASSNNPALKTASPKKK